MLNARILFWLACYSSLGAQVLPVGTVDGIITDPSGASLPNARVIVTNRDTGQARTAITNQEGYFNVQLLPPGNYSVAVEKQGFKRGVQDIQVFTGRGTTAGLRLELGQVTDSVQVTGQAPLLETSSASVNRSIINKQVQDLPLAGRNPLKLMSLVAGVTTNSNNNSSLEDISGSSYVSVNGANRRLNEFLIDGIPNNVSDRANYLPPADVVEEFTVQTNALDAEYGHGGGAFVNMTSKSGTNQFHGQLYEFLQNDKLNANSFFNNRAGRPRAPFRYNQFGAAVGGPLVPNRVFWFFNWEGIRERRPSTTFYTTPTDLQRQGDFSQTTDQDRRTMAIHDPFTTRMEGGTLIRDPFPGNRIPANRINSVSRNIIQRYPQANDPGVPGSGANNLIVNLAAPFDSDAYSGRVDTHVKSHQIFGRFSINTSFRGQPTPYDIGGLEGNNRVQTSIGAGDTWTISPTTLVTIRAGVSRWTQEGFHPQFDVSSLGFPSSLVSQMQEQIYPQITHATDLGPIGASEGNWFEHTNTYSFQTGVYRTTGRHNLKFGYQMQVKQNNSQSPQRPSGQYNFSRAFTQGPDPNRVGTNSGNSIASMLLGPPASGLLSLRASGATQSPYHSFYIQDDFKITPKLTLNLGLRYELTLGTTERYDRHTIGPDLTTPSPIEPQAKANYARNPIPEIAPADFRVVGGLLFATPDNRRNAVADRDNWAPRVGLAYRLLPRTVLRAGVGVFYSYWWNPFVSQTGFAADTTMVATRDGGRTPADLLSNPFPQGLVRPIGASLGLNTLLGQGIGGQYRGREAIRNTRWSFGFQQEIGRDMTVEVNYVGQRGADMPLSSGLGDDSRELNALPLQYYSLGARLQDPVPNPFAGLINIGAHSSPTIARRQLLLPYPQFTSVNLQRQTDGASDYHSLQISSMRRFSAGLMAQFTYTWSKLIEELRFIDPANPSPSRMIGEFDNPHRVTFAGIWELPFGRGRRFGSGSGVADKVIGGWQLNATYIYQTGAAVPLGTAALATGVSPGIEGRTIDNWFNRQSLALLPAFTPRTLPYYWAGLRQHNMNNWDVSFLKNTTLWRERLRLQFRCELINAFNRTWFANPDVNPGSGNYARVAGQANQPRIIQMGLKLQF